VDGGLKIGLADLPCLAGYYTGRNFGVSNLGGDRALSFAEGFAVAGDQAGGGCND
jgi:hypothetical protein